MNTAANAVSARINKLSARILAGAETRAYRLARQEAGAHAACPIEVVEGDEAPHVVGESCYWTTPSGKTRVEHPSAYGWPTWYHRSTLAVRVGAGWLTSQEPAFPAAEVLRAVKAVLP